MTTHPLNEIQTSALCKDTHLHQKKNYANAKIQSFIKNKSAFVKYFKNNI